MLLGVFRPRRLLATLLASARAVVRAPRMMGPLRLPALLPPMPELARVLVDVAATKKMLEMMTHHRVRVRDALLFWKGVL